MSLLDYFPDARPSGAGYTALCPAHKDRDPSLSITPGRSVAWVLHCHAGCETPDIADAAGAPWGEVAGPREDKPLSEDNWMPCVARNGHTWQETYVYRNQHGTVVLGVSRCTSKCFAQWRPDATSGSGRKWSITLPDGTKAGAGIPYRLDDLLASDALRNVWIVEGEKDANRLWSMGVPATCNAGGAGKWTAEHADWLIGRDVIIVADRDQPGRKHAEHVARTLTEIADSVEILEAAHGKDTSDHLDQGGTLATLTAVAVVKELDRAGL